uniref:Peptidase S1 domain-containing protein n=1 Tax=Plectus sambesii TaxID=2011161 RepID=A0A914VIH8_9BILA
MGKFHRGSVQIGSKDLKDWYLNKYYGIQKVIHHPEYDESDLSHDIALIKLNERLGYSERIQPICLSSDDSFFSQTKHKGYVTGWGYHSSPQRSFEFPEDDNGFLKLDEPLPHYVRSSLSNQLLQAEISFIDEDTCRLTWADAIGENQLCAGAFQKGTSMGDSGGPLQVRGSDGLWYLVGITSFGDESSKAAVLNQHKHPGVYTRVSRYCAFIAKSTKGEVACDDSGTDKQDVEFEYSHEVEYPPDKRHSHGKSHNREEDPIPNDSSVYVFVRSSSSALSNVFNMMAMVLISVYGHLLLRN